jgi:chromosomal replication initiation ATPase DnaA
MAELAYALAREQEILPPPNGRVLIAQLVVGHALGVSVARIRGRSREADAAFARHVAMYLAHVTFGLRLKDVARAFGRHRTTVGHACRRIEDMRDDVLFDSQLGWLEALVGRAARRAMAGPAPGCAR